MIKSAVNIISKFYNEDTESICTRILYFFNTVDSYFFIAGLTSFILVYPGFVSPAVFVLALIFAYSSAKLADFYPVFLIFAIPVMAIAVLALGLPFIYLKQLLLANITLFFIIQFLFMGIPDSIVARDIRVPFLKMYNSLFTIAPTTVSFLISVFFSFYLSFCLLAGVSCRNVADGLKLIVLAASVLIVAAFTRVFIPKNLFSKFHKPDIRENPLFKRVIILNIDGARKDVFDSLNLPTMKMLEQNGSYHPLGLTTIYRALTNPAFASILTGTIPKYHRVFNNNLGQSIKTEGLPDIVSSIAYGSMHVKHFCKSYWETKIVSLPRHSAYACDEIMVGWLKDDIANRKEIRLFVADFSEADFLAHAYGSKSLAYKEALSRTNKRIGEFIKWLQESGNIKDTAVIVCSDHGIAAIDHSYLIAKSERFVPFYIYGDGIKKGFKIKRPGKIMDICCTVSYLLGVRYLHDSRGQVFTEVLEEDQMQAERNIFVNRFNKLKYEAEAARYGLNHDEIYQGDSLWWDNCIGEFAKQKDNLRILDIGSGSGFVAERFLENKVNFSEFVCFDICEEMLRQAKAKIGAHPNFKFILKENELKGPFDIITASSVFHHLVEPKDMATLIDKLLANGGIVIGSHEPNKEAFKNKLFLLFASLYKAMGGGITIDDDVVLDFNRLLHQGYPLAPRVSREEILQIVEYHSPVEQYDRAIEPEAGFVPKEFFFSCFSGYEVLKLQSYTTFFHRPYLEKHKNIQSLLAVTYKMLFKDGNLFKFVLRKKHCCLNYACHCEEPLFGMSVTKQSRF